MGCGRCGVRSKAGARFCGACGSALGTAARAGVRKTVTVLFAERPSRDDPDLELGVRSALAFYETVRAVLEQYGGTVERDAGDAVMAVFGIPTAREDDALRAAAAAVALQERFPVAVGINTGEVLAGDGSADQELAVGDAVVVAARLQQQAALGEVLLGPDTARLLGPGARLGARREITLRGRTGGLPVVPLEALPTVRSTGLRGPFVGRDAEQRMLLAAVDRTAAGGPGQLLTVLGEAGTGKTRLVREVLAERQDALVVVTGTCRGWGDQSTWRPLVEVLHAVVDLPPEAHPGQVVEALADRFPLGPQVQTLLASLLGDSDVPVSAPDLAWAVAQVLAEAAVEQPVVVVLEDLHLAHTSLLSLLPDVVRRWEDARVVLVVTSRPELLEHQPDWGRGLRHVLGLTLRPLPEEQARQLALALLPDDPGAVDALVGAAGGNPLFLAQLAQARAEGAGGAAPSVTAVLAERLDRLPPAARQVLERAAVVGSAGRTADLVTLCEGVDLPAELEVLARRDLLDLSPDPSGRWAFPSELVRDAAAAGLARDDRAHLHEARGLVLAAQGANAAAGFHLEQASHLVRPTDMTRSAALAKQASARLAAAGLRALTGDLTAAADLLGRATSLMEPGSARRLALLPDLARAIHLGGDLAGAAGVLDEAVAQADALGLAEAGAHARLARTDLLRSTDPERAYAELPELLALVVPVLEHAHDDRGLSLAHQLRALALQYRLRWAAMEEPLATALHHAHQAGDRRLVELAQGLQVGSMYHGPMHLAEVRNRLEAMLEERGTSPSHRAGVEGRLAGTLALQGDPATARVMVADVRRAYADLGRELSAIATAFVSGPVELLGGNPERAVALLQDACDRLHARGDRSDTSTLAALLAEAHWRCEDPDSAWVAADLSRRSAGPDDVDSQVRWRAVQAKLLALQGRAGEALALAAEAVALVATSDDLVSQGDVLTDAAQVQELLGDSAAAQVLLHDAVRRYDRKGAPQCVRLLADRLVVPPSEVLVPVQAPATAAGADADLLLPDRVGLPAPG